MDKIITINLGGYAIKMEEDAYEALKPYIRQIEQAFENSENGKEIINDIEARIAEMLLEKSENKVAADLSDVQFVKNTMGNPSEFESGDADTANPSSGQPADAIRKRLYRDSENKILGGVCSGLSSYFNLDPTIVRLIWIASFFFFGTGLLVYLVLWIVVPEAVTTAQKLEMKGEAPTMDNIINKVKAEAGKVEQNLRSQKIEQRIAALFNRILPLFLILAKAAAAALGLFLLVVLSAVLIAMIAGTGNFVFDYEGSTTHLLPNVFDASWELITVKTLVFILLGIPVFILLSGILKFLFNSKANLRPIRIVLGWIWVATIPLLIYFVAIGIKNFRSFESITTEATVKAGEPLLIKADLMDSDRWYDRTEIRVVASEDSLIHIKMEASASGKNRKVAGINAGKMGMDYAYEKGVLTLKTSDYYQRSGLFRRQKALFTIEVPQKTRFTLDKSCLNARASVQGIDRDYYLYEGRNISQNLLFLNSELYCPSCPDSLPPGSIGSSSNRDFKSIEVEGWIEVEIKKGSRFHVQKSGPSEAVRHLELDQSGDVLFIRMEEGYFNLKSKPRVIVTMPELYHITLSGAAECKTDAFAGNRLSIGCNGASSLEMKAEYDALDVELSGASRMNLEGYCKDMSIDCSGASRFNGDRMRSEKVRLDVSGASEIVIGQSTSIGGDLSGASKLRYFGNPELQVSSNGMSKIKREESW